MWLYQSQYVRNAAGWQSSLTGRYCDSDAEVVVGDLSGRNTLTAAVESVHAIVFTYARLWRDASDGDAESQRLWRAMMG